MIMMTKNITSLESYLGLVGREIRWVWLVHQFIGVSQLISYRFIFIYRLANQHIVKSNFRLKMGK